MRRKSVSHNNTVKKVRFILSLFAAYTGVLFLMSGMHTGLLVLMNRFQCGEIVQSVVAMAYWGIVAAGITWFAVGRIRNTYEIPMRQLAEATSKVAAGDFSVYIPTIYTADKLDYVDVMIKDFNKMVEELGSIETLKTDFVSNVSHEMKTPIAIIKNYAELLQADRIKDGQRKEYAESIENAAIRLSDLIGNILKLNKLENQRITPEAEDYDVCRQLCECILQFEDAWDEKEIELEAEIEDMAMIWANASLMELVKRVLELLDGDIQIASEEGKGSTFTVTLPVAGIYKN